MLKQGSHTKTLLFCFLALAGGQAEANPIELVWHAPRLSLTKDEQIVYLVQSGLTAPKRITLRVADVDSINALYTLAVEHPQQKSLVKMFDQLSRFFPGKAVQPFEWYEQVRVLSFMEPPPSNPNASIQIGGEGNVLNSPQIFGESLMPIGQVSYKARIVGEETVDGWPCLKIEGETVRNIGEGVGREFPERSEISFSPAAGRIVRARLHYDGARTTLSWVSKPPANPPPMDVPPSLEGNSEGIAPAFPPLPQNLKGEIAAAQEAKNRGRRDEAAALATGWLTHPLDRVLVDVAPGWRWGLKVLARDFLSWADPQTPPFNSSEMRRRLWVKADGGDEPALHRITVGLRTPVETSLPPILETPQNTSPPVGLSLPSEWGPWQVITDVEPDDFVYVLSHVSSGERRILLSAWDREQRRWAFQRKWLAGFTLPEGRTKSLTIHAALDENHSALLLWFSIGYLVCADSLTGDVRWTRLLDPSWMNGQQPALAALRVFDLQTGKTRGN